MPEMTDAVCWPPQPCTSATRTPASCGSSARRQAGCTARIPAGAEPYAVAVTPDGSQVWVGNNLTGNITVINPPTDTVSATISGGSGTATLLAAPLGIAFAPAG